MNFNQKYSKYFKYHLPFLTIFIIWVSIKLKDIIIIHKYIIKCKYNLCAKINIKSQMNQKQIVLLTQILYSRIKIKILLLLKNKFKKS